MCTPSGEEYYTVDRIEEGVCVLLDGSGRELRPDGLPAALREGDVLVLQEGRFVLCSRETARRRQQQRARLDALLRRRENQ